MLLSACVTADNEEPQESRSMEIIGQPLSVSPETISVEASCSPAAGANTDVYRSLYKQEVADYDEGTVFSLIYLDGDDIPELAAGDRGNDRYSIYTVKDGAIFCMVDSMTTVELTYFERNSIVAKFARWNGGGDEGGYGQEYFQASMDKTVADGDIPVLSYSYNATYDGEGIYTGEGVTDYYYMGQEIDEATYIEISKTMEITENGAKLCLKNAISKEEMLDFLK